MAADTFGIGRGAEAFPTLDGPLPTRAMASNNKPALVSFDRLKAYIARAFVTVGMPETDAQRSPR
jgi:hypothetical protein